MSEPRIDAALQELRAAAPIAPDGLRERVRELAARPAGRRIGVRFRPALALAAALILAVGIGAAVIGGLTNSPPAGQKTERALGLKLQGGTARQAAPKRGTGMRSATGSATQTAIYGDYSATLATLPPSK